MVRKLCLITVNTWKIIWIQLTRSNCAMQIYMNRAQLYSKLLLFYIIVLIRRYYFFFFVYHSKPSTQSWSDLGWRWRHRHPFQEKICSCRQHISNLTFKCIGRPFVPINIELKNICQCLKMILASRNRRYGIHGASQSSQETILFSCVSCDWWSDMVFG